MSTATKLAKYIEDQLSTEVKDVLITRDTSGVYELFGSYIIKQTSNKYYTVVTSRESQSYEFSSLKNATSWCTLHNQKMYKEANRVANLDLRICSIQLDIAVHKNMVRGKSDDSRLTYLIKLQEANYKKRILVKELNSYINSSKNIQDSKFRSKKEHNFRYS